MRVSEMVKRWLWWESRLWLLEMGLWLRVTVVVEEAIVEVRLVGDRGRDAVYGGRRYEVGPVAEVVAAVLGVGGGREGMRVGDERVGVGEEVGEVLALDIGQQGVGRVEVVIEEAAGEGVYAPC